MRSFIIVTPSPDIMWVIKWTGHVAPMAETTKAYEVVAGKPKMSKPFERL
jgi:hypothetical protein